MTAHDFIDQLFSRPQVNVSSNVRYVSPGQLELLRTLISQGEEGGALTPGLQGGFVWTPRGRWKYVLSQNPDGTRRALMRLAQMNPHGVGNLFGNEGGNEG